MGLLQQKTSTLGHVAVKFSNLSLVRVLGKGRFCIAFESTTNVQGPDSLVTKVFNRDNERVARSELEMLEKLAEGNMKNVPLFIADELSECEQFTALVVSPMGQAVLPIHGGSRTVG